MTLANESSMQFVGFRLADQEYAFRIEQIQEIVIPDRVTRMPQVPDYVEGVSNLARRDHSRSSTCDVCSAWIAEETDDETRTIVANVGPADHRLHVDAVTQVIRISPEQIQPAPEMVKSEGAGYIVRIREDRNAADHSAGNRGVAGSAKSGAGASDRRPGSARVRSSEVARTRRSRPDSLCDRRTNLTSATLGGVSYGPGSPDPYFLAAAGQRPLRQGELGFRAIGGKCHSAHHCRRSRFEDRVHESRVDRHAAGTAALAALSGG